jgi:hypothetical protein
MMPQPQGRMYAVKHFRGLRRLTQAPVFFEEEKWLRNDSQSVERWQVWLSSSCFLRL